MAGKGESGAAGNLKSVNLTLRCRECRAELFSATSRGLLCPTCWAVSSAPTGDPIHDVPPENREPETTPEGAKE
mgnify:CR=1 FL=1